MGQALRANAKEDNREEYEPCSGANGFCRDGLRGWHIYGLRMLALELEVRFNTPDTVNDWAVDGRLEGDPVQAWGDAV